MDRFKIIGVELTLLHVAVDEAHTQSLGNLTVGFGSHIGENLALRLLLVLAEDGTRHTFLILCLAHRESLRVEVAAIECLCRQAGYLVALWEAFLHLGEGDGLDGIIMVAYLDEATCRSIVNSPPRAHHSPAVLVACEPRRRVIHCPAQDNAVTVAACTEHIAVGGRGICDCVTLCGKRICSFILTLPLWIDLSVEGVEN